MLVWFRQVPESLNAFGHSPMLAMQNVGYFIFFSMFTNQIKVSNKNLVSQFLYLIAGSDILNTFNLLGSVYKRQRGFSLHTYS